MKRKFLPRALRIIAIVLLFVVAFNALAAGYSFMADPTGSGLGIGTNYLRPTAPFTDYFFPGLVLFTLNGVLCLAIAMLTLFQTKHFETLLMVQGSILVSWILIQLMMVTVFHPLHIIIASIGVVLISIGWYLKRGSAWSTTQHALHSSFAD